MKNLTFQSFKRHFSTEDACLQYLVDQKWGDGFKCRKCGHGEYGRGRQWFYRRCKRCCYDESTTAHTIFHGVKLGLVLVFELAYRITLRKKGMSSCELVKELGCQQKTAWEWCAKLQFAMKSSEQYTLNGQVEVDEFFVGGFSPNAPVRSLETRQAVVLAIEKVIDKQGNENIGRAYARTIDDTSALCLRVVFEKHVDKQSNVKTDKWRG